jgi:dipeptidyl aminopeptidase/acylaminoacyl peptidase
MSEADARAAYDRLAIPGPGRPLFQAAFANMNPWAATKVNYGNSTRAPLLIIAGERDHTVPAVVNRIMYDKYKKHSSAVTAFKEFPNRSHLIAGQQGWEEVASYAITWAEEHTM